MLENLSVLLSKKLEPSALLRVHTRNLIAALMLSVASTIPSPVYAQRTGTTEDICSQAVPADGLLFRTYRQPDKLAQCRSLLGNTYVQAQITAWVSAANQPATPVNTEPYGMSSGFTIDTDGPSVDDRIHRMVADSMLTFLRNIDGRQLPANRLRRNVPLIRSGVVGTDVEATTFASNIRSYLAARAEGNRLSENVAQKLAVFDAVLAVLTEYARSAPARSRRIPASQLEDWAIRLYTRMDCAVRNHAY